MACERILIKTHSVENRCYRTGKYTVCRCDRASFSLEILQAGAVKGLILTVCQCLTLTVFQGLTLNVIQGLTVTACQGLTLIVCQGVTHTVCQRLTLCLSCIDIYCLLAFDALFVMF